MENNLKESSIGQMMYDFLTKCEKRNPFGFMFDERLSVYEFSDKGVRFHNEISGSLITYSYHDLFSKDSGIMEFVEWKAIDMEYIYLHNLDMDQAYICHKKERQYHSMIMGHMTAEQKIQYFLENAIIPTPLSE